MIYEQYKHQRFVPAKLVGILHNNRKNFMKFSNVLTAGVLYTKNLFQTIAFTFGPYYEKKHHTNI